MGIPCCLDLFQVSMMDSDRTSVHTHRLTVQNQYQCPRGMSHRRNRNDHPNQDPIERLRGAGQETEVAQTEGSFESSNAELIEGSACIVKLDVSVYSHRWMKATHFCISRQVCLGTQFQRQSKSISAFCGSEHEWLLLEITDSRAIQRAL